MKWTSILITYHTVFPRRCQHHDAYVQVDGLGNFVYASIFLFSSTKSYCDRLVNFEPRILSLILSCPARMPGPAVSRSTESCQLFRSRATELSFASTRCPCCCWEREEYSRTQQTMDAHVSAPTKTHKRSSNNWIVLRTCNYLIDIYPSSTFCSSFQSFQSFHKQILRAR